MVDYSKWEDINSTDEEEDGFKYTFPYPLVAHGRPTVQKLDVRPQVVSKFDGLAHGDVVLSERGVVATVIGVRSKTGPHAGSVAPRLWCHKEGFPGAGFFAERERLRVVGHLPQVPEGGLPQGRAPSEDYEWLRPTFRYVVGHSHACARFDIRDEVCLKVGGFRHGQVVRPQGPNQPGDPNSGNCVTIGVRKNPHCGAVNLWFHPTGWAGAGIFDYKDLRNLVAVGHAEVREASDSAEIPRPLVASAEATAAAQDELGAARAELQEERRRLFALSAEASGADVVELNVGGTPLTTTRGTLRHAGEGSMLAAMFSGQWDVGHKRDAQGRIFLDADPYCFGKLLSLLRLKAIERPGMPLSRPQVPEDRRVEFEAVGAYYAAPLFETNRFRAGVEVRLHGLGCDKELNDSRGWAMHFDAESHRWQVLLKNGEARSVKLSNLELVKTAPRVVEAS